MANRKPTQKISRRAFLKKAVVRTAEVGGVGLAVAAGGTGYHYVNKYIESVRSEAQQTVANSFNGMKKLDKENTQMLFEQVDGKNSFAIINDQPTGKMGYASHDMNADTHIEFDSEGNFSFKATDANDPNVLVIDVIGDPNGGSLKYTSNNAKYVTRIFLNGDPNELKSLPGYKK